MPKHTKYKPSVLRAGPAKPQMVDSLMEAIRDGNEYGSIVDKISRPDANLLDEVARGLAEIEILRSRPCLAYVGNVVRTNVPESGIDSSDDLPFLEMVGQVPPNIESVDIFLATRGGSAHQVSRFVNCLQTRFREVDFIIPSFCMSAGTLFALSGNRIWMTARACLGPIDPQVPTSDGRYVPAQALLLLVNQLQQQGEEAMKKGVAVPWTAVRIIDSLDKKELGDAITATTYSSLMASQFLQNYKFRDWPQRETSGLPVTPEYREERANEIAVALASHDRWRSHGHAISRDVLWNEIKLRIDHPDQQFERSITRLWALFNWLFEKTSIAKVIVSQNYKFVRQITRLELK